MARLREFSIEIVTDTNTYVDYDRFVNPHTALGKALLRSLYKRLPGIKIAFIGDERAREEARQYYGLDFDDHIWPTARAFGAFWYRIQQTGKPGLADVELRGKFGNGLAVRRALESLMKSTGTLSGIPSGLLPAPWSLMVCFEDLFFLLEDFFWRNSRNARE
jgi:hypothetical protein